MNKFIKVSAIAFALTASLQFTQLSVSAEGLDELGQVVDGSLLTNDPWVEDSATPLERGSLLGYVRVDLLVSEDDPGFLTVKGQTIATLAADKVYLGLILEQKLGGEWFEYCKWNINGEKITSIVERFDIPVEQGYYYRLKGIHSVQKSDEVQTMETSTSGTWVAKAR